MKHEYPDLIALANRLATAPVAVHDRAPETTPQWFDENGVPRFWPHDPKLCPCIYAHEVVLLEISCQACGQRFKVQMSTSSTDMLRHHMMFKDTTDHPYRNLAAQVKDGSIHYGDPPRHDDNQNCGAGATMNCNDLRVLEFWKNDESTDHEFKRVPELEVKLPDADEDSRPW